MARRLAKQRQQRLGGFLEIGGDGGERGFGPRGGRGQHEQEGQQEWAHEHRRLRLCFAKHIAARPPR